MASTTKITRQELAAKIAGGLDTAERPSHTRFEVEGRQVAYLQNRVLVCKDSEISDKRIRALLRQAGHNRLTYSVDGSAASIKTASRILAAAAKAHTAKREAAAR
jgi:hypothetical protein